MSHFLHALFYPKTVAVVGASDRAGSLGRKVFARLAASGIPNIVPVNSAHKTVGGQKAFASLGEAVKEQPVDTAVVVLAAEKAAGIVREAARAGISQMVLVNELDPVPAPQQSRLARAAEAARKAGIRLFAVPSGGLDGVFGQPENRAPACAYVGQSAGIADCVAAYAAERRITFSRFLTVCPQDYPADMGQIIDFTASEPAATALLVHICSPENPRNLVSALAAAARRKPVVVLATLADAEEEALLMQALARVHVLTAHTLAQFFSAAKLIHTGLVCRGKSIAVVSNSPQICTLALKTLPAAGLHLAESTPTLARAAAKLLPYRPAAANPLYLPADALPAQFQAALSLHLEDDKSDAVLAVYTGTDAEESLQTAQMAAALQRKSKKPLLAAWLGSANTDDVRTLFGRNRTLHFKQPEHALEALSQLNLYHKYNLNRRRTGAYHNYRYAAAAANELRKHVRPLLPVAVLPAGRAASAHFLTALQTFHRPDLPETASGLAFGWDKRDPFGQVLTLAAHGHEIRLLPPITPEAAERALSALKLDAAVWRDWLLNAAEILCRLPEIRSVSLQLAQQADGSIACRDIKLSLQDPDSNFSGSLNFSGSINVFTPYPHQAERDIVLKDGTTAWLRPVRPEDAELIRRLAAGQSEESRHTRFMSKAHDLPAALVARMSHPDYQRDFALILHDEDGNPLAHAGYTADADMRRCEFGIMVADRLHGQGIGALLMENLIAHARSQGFAEMRAEILPHNHAMQKLALKLGFTLGKHPQDASLVEARLDLQKADGGAA